MGTDIKKDEFCERDYSRFQERLQDCLSALGQLLDRPGFGAGPATIGAELEVFLIDGAGRPLPHNQAIRAKAADSRVTVELNRFNLELNASAVPLAGRPFAALEDELTLLLDRVARAARGCGGRLALIGILPTLGLADLRAEMMTDAPRYRALSSGLRRLRQSPFSIRIAGEDPLELASEDVAMEGANTSFQMHLRVDPADFTRTYNAVQLATAPVLAVSGNSPTFLGHRLWEETRIALYKQSVDDRLGDGPRRRPARTALGTGWVRGGALELFTDSVRLHQPLLPVVVDIGPPVSGGRWHPPPLDELRLHQSTVWPWNRAIYDPASGGHLRIEMRALPAGPTVIDMLANGAFLIGLSLWMAGQDQEWTYALPFERADHGFYRAAQHGLSAELSWPTGHRDQIRTVPAAELVAELVPLAHQALVQAGVAAAEADRLLQVITARAASGQTGAAWQRATLSAAERGYGRERALAMMLERYLQCAATGMPVHTWPVDSLASLARSPRPGVATRLPSAAGQGLATDPRVSVSQPPGALTGTGLEVPPGQRGAAQHAALDTMSAEECRTHLAHGGIGRFLFVADRGPVAVPVNFAMLGDDVVFRTDDRTAAAGAVGQQKVSFEVDHIDDALNEGWSVLLSGAASILTRPDDLDAAAELGVEPWVSGGRDTYIRLAVEEMTGRRICNRAAW